MVLTGDLETETLKGWDERVDMLILRSCGERCSHFIKV